MTRSHVINIKMVDEESHGRLGIMIFRVEVGAETNKGIR